MARASSALARYYDPPIAQFLTVDPDVTTTLSPYGYVAGNPLNDTAAMPAPGARIEAMGSTQRPWWSDPDPDPAVLRRLYVDDGRTEREIARILSISQAHLAASLAHAGIERRTVRRLCPVDARTLAELYSAPGATVASLSRRFRQNG